MARGRRTSYTRDNSGRFASSPGGGAPKRSNPAMRRAATRAGNRLNRDNSGRISGIGRNGATVRGGRLKTAKGNARATRLASMKPAGFRGGTIAKGGRGVRGMVARSLAAARKERMAGARVRTGAVQQGATATKPAKIGGKVRLRRIAAPDGAIRKSDVAKARSENSFLKAVAQKRNANGRPPLRSDARLRAANVRILRRKRKAAESKGTKSEQRQIAADKLQRSVDRAIAVKYEAARKIDRAHRSYGGPIAILERYRAQIASGKNIAPQQQRKLAKNEKQYRKALRARSAAEAALALYSKAAAPTPRKPTPKRTRASRPAGTVAKPRGMKPGVLERRGKTISRNNNASPQKVNQESVRSLLAAGQSVFVYPRKGTVVVNGFKYYKVSKAMAATLNKIVKDHRSSR